MAKEINIKARNLDELEFEITENAQAGDWFSIKNYQVGELDSLKSSMNEQIIKWKSALKEIVKKEEFKNWENQFLNSEKYRTLENAKRDLENQIKNLAQQEALKIKNALAEFKQSQEYQNLLNLQKTHEIKSENLQLRIKQELNEQHQAEIEKLNQDKLLLQEEIERRKSKNIKEMGEEFENWIQEQYDLYISMLGDTSLEKANKLIGGKKPDFIFKVLNDDRTTIEKIVIEAKTEGKHGKTKNSDHYEKLNKDRENNGAEYALLISELEPNSSFMIKKISEYSNMFVVRPGYFISFLSLIRHISLKRKTIMKLEADFKEKEDILEEFEKMKNEILSNSIKNIEKNCENIIAKAEKITDYSKSITDSAKKILETHISTAKNKIDNFNISKITRKIDKLGKE